MGQLKRQSGSLGLCSGNGGMKRRQNILEGESSTLVSSSSGNELATFHFLFISFLQYLLCSQMIQLKLNYVVCLRSISCYFARLCGVYSRIMIIYLES